MDITNKSSTELKAIAYDILVQIQGLQQSLNVINAQLDKKVKEESLSSKQSVKEEVYQTELTTDK